MNELASTGIYYKVWTPNVEGWWIFVISCNSPEANDMKAYFVESGLEKDIKTNMALESTLTTIKGSGFIVGTDTLEKIRDAIDNIKTNIQEIEKGFPSISALDDISSTGDQNTTEKTITVSLPSGASIVKASLLALITAMNNSENAQKIDLEVHGRKGDGGWSTFFSQDDVIGFGAVDGATSCFCAVQDVTSLIDEETSYGFKFVINQSSANSIRYTTQYILIIVYKMS